MQVARRHILTPGLQQRVACSASARGRPGVSATTPQRSILFPTDPSDSDEHSFL